MNARLKATTYNALLPMMPMEPKQWDRVTIGNNTTAERTNRCGGITVRLHGHEIVRMDNDRSLSFSMAGYATVTTKGRINTFLTDNFGPGVYVCQRNYVQYLGDRRSGVEVLREIDADGWVTIDKSDAPFVHTTCKLCGLDIEGQFLDGVDEDWRDRGNNETGSDGHTHHP